MSDKIDSKKDYLTAAFIQRTKEKKIVKIIQSVRRGAQFKGD